MITRGPSIARFAWVASLACVLLVASLGKTSAAIALPQELMGIDAGLRHYAGIGCKLIGGSMVCGRDGGGLLDRKILPRKRKETKPVQKKPATQTKPAPKKTSPSATTGGSTAMMRWPELVVAAGAA